jgi:NADH-quinone oxidoreductase subunit J
VATFVNWVITTQDRTIRQLEGYIRAMTFLSAQTAFYYLATASVASAILAVTRRNPVHSMLWVLALFLHVAGIFLLLGAEFLAAVQVIVYAGAILVFYIFVVMLLDLPGEEAGPRFGKHWPFAAAAGLSFAALAWYAHVEPLDPVGAGAPPAAERMAAEAPVGPAARAPMGSLSEVGRALFGPFALPFEMASLVLLAAIVGAIVLAKRRAAGS